MTGGTGFVGATACRTLAEHGHQLLILTRQPSFHAPVPRMRYCAWDADEWRRAIPSFDGIVHLAGESIAAKRWTLQRKRALFESRLETTRALVNAIAAQSQRPRVLVTASAVGYYGDRGDEPLTESAPSGRGFLAELCCAWEAQAAQARALGMRVVPLRIGIVLGRGGGVLAKMTPPFRWFLGGPLGGGRQWISWVHRDDVVGLIEWVLVHPQITTAVNATAPTPVMMTAFCRELGRVLRRPSWAPVPAGAVRLLLGEMAEMLVTGQRAIPKAALRSGYPFRYADLAGALESSLAHATIPRQ